MSASQDTDKIYAQPHSQVGDFVFDAAVAAVFPDMIRRSVPGYPAIINMIQLLTARHAHAGTRVYDLGCSLGAATLAMYAGIGTQDCQIVAVDNSPAMLARAQRSLPVDDPRLTLVCADIRDIEIREASLVVLNFTLQFLPPEERLQLLARVHRGLLPGGALILSEKIAGDDAFADALLCDMHHAFKRLNGYSELEISQKRSALERVLIPETLYTHERRLRQAGFSRVDRWFQCFNFVSLVALA